MLEDCEEINVLTPSRWNPHDSKYDHNKSQMLDSKSEMVKPNNRQSILLSDIKEDADISAACYIGHVESKTVINIIHKQSIDDDDDTHQSYLKHKEEYEIYSVIHAINPFLNDDYLYERLSNRKELSEFQIAIGSTNVSKSKCIIPDEIHTYYGTLNNLDDS